MVGPPIVRSVAAGNFDSSGDNESASIRTDSFRIRKLGSETDLRVSVRRRTDGKGRKSLAACIAIRRRRSIVAGLIPGVCETFVERAGCRGLALLVTGEGAVAPAWIVIALKAEWVSGRNLCMCACQALDGGENQQGRHPFRSQHTVSDSGMCHGQSINFEVHRDRTLGCRSRTAYAKSGNSRL